MVLTAKFPGLAQEELLGGVHIYRRLKTGSSTATIYGNLRRRFLFPKSIVTEVQRLCRELNPDIIHFLGGSIIAAPKVKRLKKPLFATIESLPTLCPKGDQLFFGKKECTTICNPMKFIACQRHSAEIGKMKNKWYLKYNPLFLGITYHYYHRLHKALGSVIK